MVSYREFLYGGSSLPAMDLLHSETARLGRLVTPPRQSNVATGPTVPGPVTGYPHASYAESLSEFGTPRQLPRSGGWILQREIPGFPDRDAMGCYPLFACRDWAGLEADLNELRGELVSLAMVTDPFGNYCEDQLRRCFPDVMFAYKDHFVVDLSLPVHDHVSPHHRRNVARAQKSVDVRWCEVPSRALDTWAALYDGLIERHGIRGIRAFSRRSFAAQLSVPGMTAFEAVHRDRTVGMLLWYVQGAVAYYHLGAHNDVGYDTRASFALFWRALEHFARRGLRWLDLGAGAGTRQAADGLTRFKRGWSTGTRPAYFCGRIFQPSAYRAITNSAGVSAETDYFPAYRQGEFV